jgi:hypothetical protein
MKVVKVGGGGGGAAGANFTVLILSVLKVHYYYTSMR